MKKNKLQVTQQRLNRWILTILLLLCSMALAAYLTGNTVPL